MDVGDARAKFEAFGWDTVEIDGHDMQQVVDALERSRTLDCPAAIVAQTKKGRGVSFMEGRFGFHGKPPSPEQAEQALEELEATLDEQTAALRARETRPDACRGEDGADRNPARLRPGARRPGRGSRGRGRARRRPRRLHPVDQVRQGVPGSLLQLRRSRGGHDVDGLWPGRHRQGSLCLDLRHLRHLALLRPGPPRDRPQRAQGQNRRLATAASPSAKTAPPTR